MTRPDLNPSTRLNAAEAPCSRCGATPETGLSEGCPECEGIVPACPDPRTKEAE